MERVRARWRRARETLCGVEELVMLVVVEVVVVEEVLACRRLWGRLEVVRGRRCLGEVLGGIRDSRRAHWWHIQGIRNMLEFLFTFDTSCKKCQARDPRRSLFICGSSSRIQHCWTKRLEINSLQLHRHKARFRALNPRAINPNPRFLYTSLHNPNFASSSILMFLMPLSGNLKKDKRVKGKKQGT